jgi:hypothetical protein
MHADCGWRVKIRVGWAFMDKSFVGIVQPAAGRGGRRESLNVG